VLAVENQIRSDFATRTKTRARRGRG